MELLKSAFCSAGEGSCGGKTDPQRMWPSQLCKRAREILLSCFSWFLLSMSCPSCCGLRAQSPLREQDHVFVTFSQNCDLILTVALWKGPLQGLLCGGLCPHCGAGELGLQVSRGVCPSRGVRPSRRRAALAIPVVSHRLLSGCPLALPGLRDLWDGSGALSALCTASGARVCTRGHGMGAAK